MSTRYWISGAHGFIGRHVARSLATTGNAVAGLGHGLWPETEAAAWGVRCWLNGDISFGNLGALAARTGMPDVVVHLAGGSSVGAAIAQPLEDFARTVSSTAVLLDWIRQESPRTAVIAVSSAAVYGDGHRSPIDENALLNPYSPYGYHKAAMESLVRSYGATYGIPGVVARLFSVYGPGLRKQLLWDLCSRLASGTSEPTLGGSGQEMRDWVHVEDVAGAIPRLARATTPEVPIVNVATGIGTPVSAIADMVIRAWRARTGAGAAVRFSGERRPGDPAYLVADCRRLTGLSCVCSRLVESGISEYVNWFISANGETH